MSSTAETSSANVGLENSIIPKPSYTFQAWQRLKNVCQALRQTEDKVRNLKLEIEAKLKSTERLREKRAEVQACRMSVQALETQLEWRRTNTRTAAARLAKARHQAADHQIRLNNFLADIDELKTELAEKQRLYIGAREKLVWAAAQLVMRRRQMVQELRAIIFIESLNASTPTNGKGSGISCNCKAPSKIINVHLPDAEDYYGHNEVELSVGLCYVVQALMALSGIFEFSLRYRLEFFGSRSCICDYVNPQLPTNQRIFPLHGRNQDKVAFQYGVFLLNKNLAQLRCDSGLITTDLRCTLANLRSLFDYLADAKLEPCLYITRAIRLADARSDDAISEASTFRRQSPSISSGAPSTDNDETRILKEPVYMPDGNHRIAMNNNDLQPPTNGSSIDRTSIIADDYAYKFTVENSNGNVDLITQTVNKDLLRTCYLAADDDE